MRSQATTVGGYLDSLPADRRAAIAAVRKTILRNLPKGYEEAVSGGVLAYQIPLALYPDTYNKQPLMYAALASQKNYMSVYLMCAYTNPRLRRQLEAGFKAAGKRLDMGKSCIRFKSIEDLPLNVIGTLIAAVPMKTYLDFAKKVFSKRK